MTEHPFDSPSFLQLPAVYGVANVDEPAEPLEFVRELCDAGLHWIQIRSKRMKRESLLKLVQEAVEISQDFDNVAIIVNDDIRLAAEAGAHGVHLGQTDDRPEEARRLLGPNHIIGFSTHNLDQLRYAPFAALNYVALGPIFDSQTKSGHAPVVGTEMLKQAVQLSPIPVVAIGGITSSNAAEVYAAGASSVACIQALAAAKDKSALVQEFEALAKGSQQ